MKDFLSLACDRRSIRAFSPRPVEFEKVLDVLRAATYAPSVGDMQPWRFVVVTDPDVRASLCTECPAQDWAHNAPLLLVLVSEMGKVCEYYGMALGELWCGQTCAAAVQNMLLAVTDLGLGACWIGSFDAENVRDILKIPDGFRPEAVLALGYPDETPQPKTLTPLDQFVYFNAFGRKTEDMSLVLRDYGEHFQKRRLQAQERVSSSSADARKKLPSLSGLTTRVKESFRKQK